MNGNELTRSDGARFVLKGVAVHFVPEYNDQSMVNTAATDWMYHTDILSEMQSMGINAIRIPINTDMYETGQVMTKAQWLQRFRDIVTAANSYGIRVMFGWWDSLSEQGSWANQYANAFPAMEDVVNAIGVNPMVMYEPWNEPNGVSADDWQTGMQATVKYWRQTIGYRGPLFIDTTNWSWDFDPAQATTLMNFDAATLGGGRPNIVFANHRYANLNQTFAGSDQQNFESTIEANVGKFPIAGTEYGNYNSTGPPQPTWDSQFMTYLSSTSVPAGLNGSFAFTWDWVDDNGMVFGDGQRNSAYDVTALNQWGTTYLDDFLRPLSAY